MNLINYEIELSINKSMKMEKNLLNVELNKENILDNFTS